MAHQYTNIMKVHKNSNGKVNTIHCGIDNLNCTVYDRIELDGERFFRCSSYGKNKVYRADKETRSMVFVKQISDEEMREAWLAAQKTLHTA